VLNIAKEIELRNDYLGNSIIDTIYFGGGTPSILTMNNLKLLLSTLNSNFTISKTPEVTLEANPDDLTYEYLHEIRSIGINRLSIGIQSFNDSDLKMMKRRHLAIEAEAAILLAKSSGFSNISIDLIYGMDFSSDQRFIENIDKAIALEVQHISAYHLTIEEKTAFHLFQKKGKLKEIEESRSNEQLLFLRKRLIENGFEHYEISNFAKPHYISRHNSNYWKQVPYLGIGPSAHSYNGHSRQWNVANVMKYNKSLDNNILYFDKEVLSEGDKFNDYIITSLRTKWGIDTSFLENSFAPYLAQHFIKSISKFLKNNDLILDKQRLTISEKSIFLTDYICSELIYVQ
jgi:oxygen-independent coproporphyrinogen-3 oxidase